MKTFSLALCIIILGVVAGTAMAAATPPAVEVHGYLQVREYINTVIDDSRDTGTGVITDEKKKSHLEFERVSLSGLARLGEGKVAYGEVYIHPWLLNSDPSFLYLESLYLDVPQTPDVKARLGKGRNQCFGIVPAYGNRKFSNYSPLEEAFTMDRVLGVQAMSTFAGNSLNFAVLNSQRPGTRYIGMAADSQLDIGDPARGGSLPRTTVAHLCNRDVPADRSGDLEFDARLGRQMGCFNVGLSGRLGRLDSTDLAFLTGKFGSQVDGQDRRQYGLDVTYKRAPYYGTLQYYAGPTGGIGQSGYEILFGVEPSKQCTWPWDDLSGACKGLFVRYTKLDIDVVHDIASPITWDTSQFAASWVVPLPWGSQPGLGAKWLQIEYEWNHEDVPNGGDQIPNNVFFVELFVAF